MKIGVVGSGSWGTALAQVLVDNGHEVLIYGVASDEIDDININRKNSRYFGDTLLPEKLRATLDAGELKGYADAFILAVPTKFFKSALDTLKPYLLPSTVIINVAKGFSWDTNERLSVYIRACLKDCQYRTVLSLIGPSHAEEVILRKLTLVAAVSQDEEAAKAIQQLFSNAYLRVYTVNDEIGAEYGVAMKNVIAIASGILDGIGYGDNAKAALIARGLREMVRYGVAKGGEKDTFFGLTGVGDLIVTCFSPHSRNYRAGMTIGRADSASALDTDKETIEGVHSCYTIYHDAQNLGIDMPIISAIYSILYEGEEPRRATEALMQRPLKSES